MKEFVEKLREKADVFEKSGCSVDGIVKDYRKSADMIEELYEKSDISGFVEKLIERLDEEKNTASKTFANFEMQVDLGRVFGLEKAIEIINQLAEEYNPSKTKSLDNGWIPCIERLPEVFDNVLISTIEGGRTIGHRCPNQAFGRFYDLHSFAIDNVIAWQPLPSPYKPEEKPEKPQTNFYSERFNRVI